MKNLKPCPFCGSTNVIIRSYPHKVTFNGRQQHSVMCHNCGCQTKRVYSDVNKVIALWNNRTNKIVVHNGENYEVVQK